jgi:hypothetical protein
MFEVNETSFAASDPRAAQLRGIRMREADLVGDLQRRRRLEPEGDPIMRRRSAAPDDDREDERPAAANFDQGPRKAARTRTGFIWGCPENLANVRICQDVIVARPTICSRCAGADLLTERGHRAEDAAAAGCI